MKKVISLETRLVNTIIENRIIRIERSANDWTNRFVSGNAPLKEEQYKMIDKWIDEDVRSIKRIIKDPEEQLKAEKHYHYKIVRILAEKYALPDPFEEN